MHSTHARRHFAVLVAGALLGAVAVLTPGAGAGAQASPKQAVVPSGATRSPMLTPGIRVGDLLFLSGQLGGRDSTIEGQTKQALENMKPVLDAAGTTVDNIVKCTVFLTDVNDFARMNEAYRAFFSAAKDPPARSTVVVAALVRAGAKVEIECIAAIPK
ncbi:MAG TPA: RidA family protein [Gemmatimonadaceae bacterium]|nr:RidA family protein [Gemmatimonadaceae bacterium]